MRVTNSNCNSKYSFPLPLHLDVSICPVWTHVLSIESWISSCQLLPGPINNYVVMHQWNGLHGLPQLPSYYFSGTIAPSEKLTFELEVALVSSCSWVTVPNHLCMWTGGTFVSMFGDCYYLRYWFRQAVCSWSWSQGSGKWSPLCSGKVSIKIICKMQ